MPKSKEKPFCSRRKSRRLQAFSKVLDVPEGTIQEETVL